MTPLEVIGAGTVAVASLALAASLAWWSLSPWFEDPVAADLADPTPPRADPRVNHAVEIAVLEYLIKLHRENFGRPIVVVVDEMQARADELRKEMGW